MYWHNASYEEKLTAITYLRECFYGPKATTGRHRDLDDAEMLEKGDADKKSVKKKK